MKEKNQAAKDPYQPLHDHYSKMVKQAKIFAQAIASSDDKFEKEEVNDVYLEGMIVGWISAQPWHAPMERAIWVAYPREDILNMIHDYALQAAVDAIGEIGMDAVGIFSVNEKEVAVKQLAAMDA